MSSWVVDASVAAKWFFDEIHKERARRLVAAREPLHASEFLLMELDNVVCTNIKRKIITHIEARAIRSNLRDLQVEWHSFAPLLDAAFDIANATGRSVYDCHYIALAIRLGCPMVTADRRLREAVASGPFAAAVVWIEDLTV